MKMVEICGRMEVRGCSVQQVGRFIKKMDAFVELLQFLVVSTMGVWPTCGTEIATRQIPEWLFL